MKKSLLALAVLGSFAAAAQAQNVTLYGTVAHSVSQYKVESSGAEADATFVAQGTGTAPIASSGGDFLSSTVLGIRGSEDLGKGLKAGFQFEGDLDESGGTVSFNRHQWISVGYDEATVKVGRVQDIAKTMYSVYGFNANLFDSVQGQSQTQMRAGLATQLGSRQPNTVALEGKVVGVQYQAAYSNNIGSSTNAPLAFNGSSAGANDQATIGAMTAVGPVNVGLAYVTRGTGNGVGTSGYVVGLGGKLFGVALGLNYLQNEDDGGQNRDANSIQLNAVAPLGGGFSVHGNVITGEKDQATGKLETTAYGALLVKDFSKRTAAFAGLRFAEVEAKGGAAASGNVEETLYTVGLQHKF